MNVSIKIRDVIYTVIIGVLIYSLYYVSNRDASVFKSNINALSDSVEVYRDKLNRSISEKAALLVDADNLKILTKQNDSLRLALKNIKPEVIIKTKTKIEYRDTIIIKPNKNGIYNYNSEYLSFGAKIVNEGLQVYNTKITLNQWIITGKKDMGLFKKSYYTVRVVNDNRFATTNNIETFKIYEVVPAYRKPLVVGSVSIALGLLIGVLI